MASAKKLTDVGIERLRPSKARTEHADARIPGLRLVLQPSGAKSWAFRYRLSGKTAKFTLGGYPALSLAEARSEAEKAAKAIAKGRHPLAVKREVDADTFEAAMLDWLKRDQAGNRTHAEVKRVLEREVLPKWRNRPISSIERRDCRDVIDAIADRGALTYARRVHAYLHRMFRWCVGRDKVAANPLADLPKPGAEVKRDRVLNDGELVEVWRAAAALGYPFGNATQLLILTAARREEISAITWPEVNLEKAEIRLAGERTKNGEPRTIPLAPLAVKILKALPRVKPEKGAGAYVFTTNAKSAISGWSKAKVALDEQIAEGRSKAAADSMPGWRIHDLRRSAATGLQRLGMRLEVVEAVLGHVSGSRAGVVGIYQRHSFDDEKRSALEAWDRYLNLIGHARIWAGVSAYLNAEDEEGDRRDKIKTRLAELRERIRKDRMQWHLWIRSLAHPSGQGVAKNVVKLKSAGANAA